ncbi:hypothetical protein [Desulfospira joergensenii]|uniref:hypothetical protein n=1 Tax=Desulfospira joergensenii TaxID=53329 RepID=UPI0003B61433|nr:hypothetical protein [Desulfospira joergensenii]
MKTLHIYRTEPDETVKTLLPATADREDKEVALYEPDLDWEALVEDIFSADKVISWW